MTDSIVCARKSIHDRISPVREQSYEEDEPIPDQSIQNLPNPDSDPGSDEEENQDRVHFRISSYSEIRTRQSLSLQPQRSERAKSLMKIVNQTTFKSNRKSKRWPVSYICSVLLVLAVIYVFINPRLYRDCSFENLKKEYPNENPRLWIYLKVGVESILNRKTERPMVYLFTHQGGDKPYKLITDIATRASSCFGRKLIPMERDDFLSKHGALDDYGYVIEKYKSKIKDGNVILIANLNEIAAEAARALHFICDTYSPIDQNAVILLALEVDATKTGNADAIAEQTLKELWGSKLSRNVLDPLITRVTDQVIVLNTGAQEI